MTSSRCIRNIIFYVLTQREDVRGKKVEGLKMSALLVLATYTTYATRIYREPYLAMSKKNRIFVGDIS
jgi:hypothetical protein